MLRGAGLAAVRVAMGLAARKHVHVGAAAASSVVSEREGVTVNPCRWPAWLMSLPLPLTRLPEALEQLASTSASHAGAQQGGGGSIDSTGELQQADQTIGSTPATPKAVAFVAGGSGSLVKVPHLTPLQLPAATSDITGGPVASGAYVIPQSPALAQLSALDAQRCLDVLCDWQLGPVLSACASLLAGTGVPRAGSPAAATSTALPGLPLPCWHQQHVLLSGPDADALTHVAQMAGLAACTHVVGLAPGWASGSHQSTGGPAAAAAFGQQLVAAVAELSEACSRGARGATLVIHERCAADGGLLALLTALLDCRALLGWAPAASAEAATQREFWLQLRHRLGASNGGSGGGGQPGDDATGPLSSSRRGDGASFAAVAAALEALHALSELRSDVVQNTQGLAAAPLRAAAAAAASAAQQQAATPGDTGGSCTQLGSISILESKAGDIAGRTAPSSVGCVKTEVAGNVNARELQCVALLHANSWAEQLVQAIHSRSQSQWAAMAGLARLLATHPSPVSQAGQALRSPPSATTHTPSTGEPA